MAFEGVHRVGHVGIWVSDIEKSLEWYRDVVGLKLTGIWGEPYRNHRMCFVRCEDWHHDIVFFEIDKEKDRSKLDQSDTGKRHSPGVHHIAFETDDIVESVLYFEKHYGEVRKACAKYYQELPKQL